MLKNLEGKPFTDLDEFVCDNPCVGFVLVCDRTGETLEIPGDKAECLRALYEHALCCPDPEACVDDNGSPETWRGCVQNANASA